MKSPFCFHSKDLRTAVVFALFSQAVWLPIFYTSTMDNLMYSHRTNDLKPNLQSYSSYLNSKSSMHELKPVYSSSLKLSSASSPNAINNTGIVLRSAFQDRSIPFSSQSRVRSVVSPYLNSSKNMISALHPRTLIPKDLSSDDSNASGIGDGKVIRWSVAGNLTHNLYSQSELLGGTLTLRNINEPLMPALARAERAQWNRSGDPLSPLPHPWREPMRRALSSLLEPSHSEHKKNDQIDHPNLPIDSARLIHIPSSRINRTTQVPLALQSDGSIDIFSKTVDPVLLDEIHRWSVKQTLPQKGKISAAVVNIHPISPHSVDPDLINIKSGTPIAPAPGHAFLSKSPSVEKQSVRPSLIDQRLTVPVEDIPSQHPPVILSDSSDMRINSSSPSSPQTPDRNSGNSMTDVPQPGIQGPAGSLQEVGS